MAVGSISPIGRGSRHELAVSSTITSRDMVYSNAIAWGTVGNPLRAYGGLAASCCLPTKLPPTMFKSAAIT
jgi:hypothetical protein